MSIHFQVDGLDIKVDRLSQLASSLLEHHIRQLTSVPIPPPVAPIIINRIRTGNRFHVHRRRRQRTSRSSIPTSIRPVSTENSSRANLTQPSTSSLVNNSHESLIHIYDLFQDNLNASKTDLV